MGPADLDVIVDLRDGRSGHAPSITTNGPVAPAFHPDTKLVPPHPQPPPIPPSANRPSAKSFAAGETIPVGVQRMTLALIDRALAALRGNPGDDDVHRARKSMRRVRGILRLVRDGLGPAYRAENAVMRDTARLLSDVRSSAVAGTALQDLLDRFGPLLADGIYVEMADQLSARHDLIARRTLDNRLLMAGVVTNLEHARTRLAAFPTTPGADFGYHGPLLPNDSHLFVQGITRTYRRGLVAMKGAAASPFPEQIHEWRKRVRYLRSQMEALCPAWPEVMEGLCASLDQLSETLGHERDLWELAETVRTEPELCTDSRARELLYALTLETRQATREASFRLGTRVYVEEPAAFARRIQSYWDAWTAPTGPMAP